LVSAIFLPLVLAQWIGNVTKGTPIGKHGGLPAMAAKSRHGPYALPMDARADRLEIPRHAPAIPIHGRQMRLTFQFA